MGNAGGTMSINSSCSGLWHAKRTRCRLAEASRRTPMNVAVYVRVSTNRQHQAQTIEQQLDRVRAYIAAHSGWQLANAHIYRDDGYSGASLSRPGLDRLRDHAAFAAFERVLITEV